MSKFRYPTDGYASDRELRELLRHSRQILVGGDSIPEPFIADIRMLVARFGLKSRAGPNRTFAQINSAFRKGDVEFRANAYNIQNALPNRTGPTLLPMLASMKLSYLNPVHVIAWRRVAQSLEDHDRMKGSTTATRNSLVNVLKNGSENVLVLYAHNAENKIYFPNGSTLSFEELSSIKRETAPDRAVILITCEAGGNQGDTLTLSETLLANNLATTVFASSKPVNANDVPAIVDRLNSVAIRDALGKHGFEQIVENEHATNSW